MGKKITSQSAKKQYILKTWKASSGKRIAAMLRRYWKPKKDIISVAKDIFKNEV